MSDTINPDNKSQPSIGRTHVATNAHPDRINHPVWSDSSDATGSGHALRIPYATTSTGEIAVWDLRPKRGPHWLISGPAATGKTTLIRTAAIELAASEIAALVIQSRPAEASTPFRPITAEGATTEHGAIVAARFTRALADEVDARAAYIRQHELTADDLPILAVIIDELDTLVRTWRRLQTAGEPSTRAALADLDPIDAIRGIISLSRIAGIRARRAGIRLCVGVQRLSDLAGVGNLDGIRAAFGTRTTLGALTASDAETMWGDATLARPTPPVPGRAVLTSASGEPINGQVWWTPDARQPASDADQRLSAALAALIPTHAPAPVCYAPTLTEVLNDTHAGQPLANDSTRG